MCVDDEVPGFNAVVLKILLLLFPLIQMHPIYQMVAKKSQEAKKDTAKLKKVQDQAISIIEVKKSLINLAMKSSDENRS